MVVVKALRVWRRWGSSGTEIAEVVLVHMKTKPKCLNPFIHTASCYKTSLNTMLCI